MPKIIYAALSDAAGYARNEDAMLVANRVWQGESISLTGTCSLEDRVVFACADGLHVGFGATWASRTLLQGVQESYDRFPDWPVTKRVTWLQAFLTEQGTETPHAGAASTLVCAEVRGCHVRLFHVGDSRAWSIREGRATLLTTDQTYGASLGKAILSSGCQAGDLASIYDALVEYFLVDPYADAPQAVARSFTINPGDTLMLGTDGLSHLELTEIATLATGLSPQDTAAAFLDRSLPIIRRFEEGNDNRSAIMIVWRA